MVAADHAVFFHDYNETDQPIVGGTLWGITSDSIQKWLGGISADGGLSGFAAFRGHRSSDESPRR